MGHSKGSPKREFLSNTSLPKKDRNMRNKQCNLISTRTRETTNKIQTKKKEGNKQDQSRIK